MATKKAAKKKPPKKSATCAILRINADKSITPPTLTLKDNECIRLRSPVGFNVEITFVIKLEAGGGGAITIHS